MSNVINWFAVFALQLAALLYAASAGKHHAAGDKQKSSVAFWFAIAFALIAVLLAVRG